MDSVPVAVVVRVKKLPTPADFAGRPTVDGRTATQWLKAAIAYCNYRAGDAWCNLGDPAQRNDEKRWYYLNGARFLTDHLLRPEEPKRPVPALAPARLSPSPSPFQIELAAHLTRAELVARLVKADPLLTDVRLLSCFTRLKLAGMVIRAERLSLARESANRVRSAGAHYTLYRSAR